MCAHLFIRDAPRCCAAQRDTFGRRQTVSSKTDGVGGFPYVLCYEHTTCCYTRFMTRLLRRGGNLSAPRYGAAATYSPAPRRHLAQPSQPGPTRALPVTILLLPATHTTRATDALPALTDDNADCRR